jgi:hypothetical protein
MTPSPFVIIYPSPFGDKWHCRAFRWGHRFATQVGTSPEEAEELMLEAFNDFSGQAGIHPRTMAEDGVRRLVIDREQTALQAMNIYGEDL